MYESGNHRLPDTFHPDGADAYLKVTANVGAVYIQLMLEGQLILVQLEDGRTVDVPLKKDAQGDIER